MFEDDNVTEESLTSTDEEIVESSPTEAPSDVTLAQILEKNLNSEEEAPSASEEKQDQTETKEEEKSEFTDEELNQLHEKTRKRVTDLVSRVSELTTNLSSFEKEATEYRNIKNFLAENNVSGEEANEAFQVLALIRNDPQRALEMLNPLVEQLRASAGEVLPDDLYQQVEAGYITPEYAKELSILRARENLTASQQQQKTEQERNASLQNYIATWEQNWSASDPEYKLKLGEVQEQIELALSRMVRNNSLPKTNQEINELLEKAKRTVDDRYKKFKPPVKPIGHVPSSSSNLKNKNVSEATDSVSAILEALSN